MAGYPGGGSFYGTLPSTQRSRSGGGGASGGRKIPAVNSRTTAPAKLMGKQGGNSGPYSPFGDLMGELMGALGGAWDTPGTPGHMVSQAGLRASLQAANAQAEANRASVFNQILGAVEGREKDISGGYARATKDMRDNARARALADRQAASDLAGAAAGAAAAMGLQAAPPSERAQATMEGNIGQYQSIADAWGGFNGAAAQTALQRNDAIGDSFRYIGAQQAAELQRQLLQALAGAQDYYVGGSGGQSLSMAQRVKLLTSGINADLSNTRNSIATTKLRPRATDTTPTGKVSYYL